MQSGKWGRRIKDGCDLEVTVSPLFGLVRAMPDGYKALNEGVSVPIWDRPALGRDDEDDEGRGLSMIRLARFGLVLAASALLAACGIFGGDDKDARRIEEKTTALGVNGYLWQASLETLSFMPIDSADPAAAVIVTGWHTDPATPTERVKVMVRFLSEKLRSDGIRVSVVREARAGSDQAGSGDAWVAVPVQAATALQIEEAILAKARTLRVGAVQ